MSKLVSTARRICEFARCYRSEHERTPRQIYEDTGYADFYAQLVQEDIEAIVAQDPTLVDEWFSFTEDKRWTPAWGLTKRERTWVVFRLSSAGVGYYEVVFDSPIPACALAIRMEMEDFRRTGELTDKLPNN